MHQIEELRKATAIQSTYIESILRHRMIAGLSSELWKRNCQVSLQIFNPEVDNSGFDIVLKLNQAIRYVQIKQVHDRKLPPHCSTRATFSKLTGSCIVLVSYNWDDLTISGYRFHGEMPHEPMRTVDGYKPSVSPGRRNAQGERHIRGHYRNVPLRQFSPRLNCEELLDRLFPSYLPMIRLEHDPLFSSDDTWTTPNGETADEYVDTHRSGWSDEESGQ